MDALKLIHPIYLDVPMMVSFVAAMKDGLSFESEISSARENSSTNKQKLGASFGVDKLLSALFQATVEADKSSERQSKDTETSRENKSHTQASIAIILYNELRKTSGYVFLPDTAESLHGLQPGILVELRGVVRKNAVDAIIDYIDAINILSTFGGSEDGRSRPASSRGPAPASVSANLAKTREALDRDRKRTPISNSILHVSQPAEMKAVLTLRTSNLRDLTLSELHKNTVTVVGKVTRSVEAGERLGTFENYGLSLMSPEVLNGLFQGLAQNEQIKMEFSELVLDGPAIQVLPLMIFV